MLRGTCEYKSSNFLETFSRNLIRNFWKFQGLILTTIFEITIVYQGESSNVRIFVERFYWTVRSENRQHPRQHPQVVRTEAPQRKTGQHGSLFCFTRIDPPSTMSCPTPFPPGDKSAEVYPIEAEYMIYISGFGLGATKPTRKWPTLSEGNCAVVRVLATVQSICVVTRNTDALKFLCCSGTRGNPIQFYRCG